MGYRVKEIFYTLQGEGAHSGRAAVFCRFAECNLWSGREEDREKALCRFCDTDFVGTDGPGGGEFESAKELADAVAQVWPVRTGGAASRTLQGEDTDSVGAASRTLQGEDTDSVGAARRTLQGGDPGSVGCGLPHRSPEPPEARAWPAADLANGRKFVVLTGGEPLLQLDAPLLAALHGAGFVVAIETNGTLPVPAGIDWVCVSPKSGCPLSVRGGDELKLVFPQEGVDPAEFEGLDFKRFYLQPRDGSDRERNTRLAVAYCLEHPRWRLSLQLHKILGIP